MRLVKTANPVLSLVLCLLSLVAHGETLKDEPLIAILSLPTETLCVGTDNLDTAATISFTNRLAKNILLKMSGERNVMVLGLFGTRTLRPLVSSWTSMSNPAENGTSSDLVVRPGETINYQLRFKLASEVLMEPGFYKLQISYNAVSLSAARMPSGDLSGKTNWLVFQVHECVDR